MRQCPYCNFRMFTDSPRCSKCGELLPPDAGARRTSERGGSPVKGGGIPPRVETPRLETKPVIIPPPPIQEASTESEIVPYTPPPPIQSPELAPPITPFFNSPLAPLGSPPPPLAPPTPLPKSMARYNPPLAEGEVVDADQLQDEDKSGKAGDVARSVIGAAMLPVNFTSGVMLLASGLGRPKNYKQVTIFRVRTPANDIVEVRIEKQIKNGSIRLGDYVSVWGKETGGGVLMMMGYNHTTKVEIRLG